MIKTNRWKFISLAIIFSLVLLLLPVPATAEVEREWDVGSTHSFSTAVFFETKGEDKNSHLLYEVTRDYKIVEYDSDLGIADISSYDILSRKTHNYTSKTNASTYELLPLFSLKVKFNTTSEGLFFTNLLFGYSGFSDCWLRELAYPLFTGTQWPLFIQPDWSMVNELFLASLADEAQIVLKGAKGGEGHLTLAEFLSSIPSYTIMGNSSLAGARAQLTNETHRWTMGFVLDNMVYYNAHPDKEGNPGEEPVWQAYDEYRVNFILEYSTGGILNECRTEYSMKANNVNSTARLITLYTDNIIIPTTIPTPGFEIYSILIGTMIVAIITHKLDRRRNKEL